MSSSSDKLEDMDVEALENYKIELLRKTALLRNKLAKEEQQGCRREPLIDSKLPETEREFDFLLEKGVESEKQKCVNAAAYVLGVQFADVDRKWLSKETFVYTASAKAKFLKFFVELTVDYMDKKAPKVMDITCHFIGLNQCYILEISPWIQEFTKARAFSPLCSMLSEYAEQSTVRAKLISKYQQNDYYNAEECMEDRGGVLVYINSPKDVSRICLKIHWLLDFSPRARKIENCFAIETIDAGKVFLEKTELLLQRFCRFGLKKNELEGLWYNLCDVIENLETSESGIDETGESSTA